MARSSPLSPRTTTKESKHRVVGLFAGIGRIELGPDAAGHFTSALCALEPAGDDCCECCGDAFTDTSPSSPSSVDPSICEWCYVNGYDDDCDQDE